LSELEALEVADSAQERGKPPPGAGQRELLTTGGESLQHRPAGRARSVAGGELPRHLTKGGKLARAQLELRAREVARLVGGERLRGGDGGQQTRRKEIEWYGTLLGVGTRHAGAVELCRRIALSESSHEDVAAALHGHTAHASRGLCGVAIGALGDLLRRHRAHYSGGGALRIERLAHTPAFGRGGHHLRRQHDGGGLERD